MERVAVLHEKLAPAHETEARSHLVAELHLDLIQVERQLSIRSNLAPDDVRHAVAKVKDAGNSLVVVTERGTSFVYHNLVVDMRAFPMIREGGTPVIFDVTHSLQLPGAGDGVTAGLAQYIEPLASAGVAAGVDGVFLEVHDDPSRARSDAQNALRLDLLEPLLTRLMALDAIVKRADAAYVGGRSRTWLKLKCRPRQEFVIGGYTAPAGSRQGFGSLLLGVHDDDGRLRYAGRVGTGFGGEMLTRLAARLGALKRTTPPFADDARRLPRGAKWVRPALVAEVEFTGWTDDRLLRQASFDSLQ